MLLCGRTLLVMRLYRWPALLGLGVFIWTLALQYQRYGLDSAAIVGGLMNGAIVYAVASVALLVWRKLRGRPLSDPPLRSRVDRDRDRPGWR